MELDDLVLINHVLGGNNAAFRTLVERYQDYVFTITHRILRKREEAEEAAQDAFLKAYKMLNTFERKSKFSTWLYTIAYRTAIDALRRQKPEAQSLSDTESFLQLADKTQESPAEQLQSGDVQEVLQQAIQRLKPEDGTLVTLYYLHEKTVKEIAKITGLTESNVKVKLHRLREALKQQLSHLLKEEVKDLL